MLGSLPILAEIIVGVGFLIFVHELGHFCVAKWSGVRVEAFSLGFGHAIWERTWKGTRYRIAWIPLGGYVKMAGEVLGEARSGASDELFCQPAWKRFLIFAAGSCMNLLAAFPLVMLAYLLGVKYVAPVVGSVMPESAEWDAGFRRGDEIRAVDGRPIRSLEDYRNQVLLLGEGAVAQVVVDRGGLERSLTLQCGGIKKYGLNGFREPIVEQVMAESPAAEAGFLPGDVVTAIDGAPAGAWEEIEQAVQRMPPNVIRFTVRRSGKVRDILATPRVLPDRRFAQFEIEALAFPVVRSVRAGSPAQTAGLEPEDRIVSAAGRPMTSFADLQEVIQGHAGVEMELVVERKGDEVRLTAIPERGANGEGMLGVLIRYGKVFAAVPERSPLAAAGVQPGDELLRVGTSPDDWEDAADLMALGNAVRKVPLGERVYLEVRRDEKLHSFAVVPPVKEIPYLGIVPQVRSVEIQYGPVAAVTEGVRRVVDLFHLTLEMIRQLLTRRLSPEGLAGPLGILQISYTVAQEGPTKFLMLLALLTINLGIVNLLPVPLLDGGHIVFLLIEKVKGSPLNDAVLIGAQYVGLVLLLGLIVFVTYQDIFRLLSFS